MQMQVHSVLTSASAFCICIRCPRPERVGDQIRSELAQLLAREVHDPGIGFLTLTHVKVTPDLQLARVYYTTLGDDKAQRESARARSSARRRSCAASSASGCGCGACPSSTFFYDESIADRIASSRSSRSSKRTATDAGDDADRRDDDDPATTTESAPCGKSASAIRRAAAVRASPPTRGRTATRSDRSSRWRTRSTRSARRSALVNADPAPAHYLEFPGVDRIEIAREVAVDDVDAVIVMECGDLARTGVDGLDGRFIDQHRSPSGQQPLRRRSTGSTSPRPRAARWCSTLIRALGVPLTLEIATHIYLAILTDTGSFHHSNITPRTFDICRADRRGRRRTRRRWRGASSTATASAG